jgi:dCMP deaminase
MSNADELCVWCRISAMDAAWAPFCSEGCFDAHDADFQENGQAYFDRGTPVITVGSREELELVNRLLENRPAFDAYYLEGAQWAGRRSDCRRRQQGTIIVGDDNRVISTGYIGVAPGEAGCIEGACPRGRLSFDEVAAYASYDEGPGRCISTHSEANALIYGDYSRMRGATLYTWPGEPCTGCRKLIRAAGIVRVVWQEGEYRP